MIKISNESIDCLLVRMVVGDKALTSNDGHYSPTQIFCSVRHRHYHTQGPRKGTTETFLPCRGCEERRITLYAISRSMGFVLAPTGINWATVPRCLTPQLDGSIPPLNGRGQHGRRYLSCVC